MWFLGELINWYRALWSCRRRLNRPPTPAELLNGRDYDALSRSVEAGDYTVAGPVEVFPWNRRRADDEG